MESTNIVRLVANVRFTDEILSFLLQNKLFDSFTDIIEEGGVFRTDEAYQGQQQVCNMRSTNS